jgi:hypothetical protein
MQEYHIVVRNGNSSPGSNNFQVLYGLERTVPANTPVSPPTASYTSNDSGSTWTAQGTQRNNFQVIYNTGSGDFTYDWLVTYSSIDYSLVNNPIGVRFTTPSGVRLRVIGVQFAPVVTSGSVSWAIRIKQGGNTLATTLTLSRYTGYNYFFLPFTDTVVLEPDAQTDVEAFVVSGTSASVIAVRVDTWLSPLAWPFQHIESGNVVSGRFPQMMKLILDPSQPFEVVSGGGGQSAIPPLHRIIS